MAMGRDQRESQEPLFIDATSVARTPGHRRALRGVPYRPGSRLGHRKPHASGFGKSRQDPQEEGVQPGLEASPRPGCAHYEDEGRHDTSGPQGRARHGHGHRRGVGRRAAPRHLRGCENMHKRLLIHTAAFNLGLPLRSQIGSGTPRQLAEALAQGLSKAPKTFNACFSALWDVLCRSTSAPMSGKLWTCQAGAA